MERGYKNLRECIFKSPVNLSSLPESMRVIVNSYIPYSTGIEIECHMKHGMELSECISFDRKVYGAGFIFTGFDMYEKRFRLHSGVQGLIELYHMTEIAKEYFLLNSKSGIHYHIDMTDVYDYLPTECDYMTGKLPSIDIMFPWLLKELDEWGYTGNFNRRGIGVSKQWWVRPCEYLKTLEFRIGEMTFDYEVLVKRILHCQSIVKRIKKYLRKQNELKKQEALGLLPF